MSEGISVTPHASLGESTRAVGASRLDTERHRHPLDLARRPAVTG